MEPCTDSILIEKGLDNEGNDM